MKSSRHSGNSVHCPRSASSTKRLIDPPTESRGNHNSGTAFSHSQGHSRYFPDVRVRPFISKAGNKRTSREVARRPQTSLHVRLRQAGCLVWNGGLIGAFDEPESSLRPVTGLLRGLRRGLRLPLTEFGEG